MGITEISAERKRQIRDLIRNGYLVVGMPAEPRSATVDYVRVGKYGGLPWDVQTQDVVIGCLPVSSVCYGQCFAAEHANAQGIEFGRRVNRLFDEVILRDDFDHLPDEQHWVRQGWNGDPSWNWTNAIRLGQIANSYGRHIVYNTKIFRQPSDEQWDQLVSIGAELRVAVGALDVNGSFENKLEQLLEYRERGGVAVATIITSKYRYSDLNDAQDSIVNYLREHDLPACELPLRASILQGTGELLDASAVETDSFRWFGRLFDEELRIPILCSTNSSYTGLPSGKDSEISGELLSAVAMDITPTFDQLRGGASGVPSRVGKAPKYDGEK